MIQALTHITILVKNQEEALRFYTEKLGFKLHTDAQFGTMRWLTVTPEGQPDMEFVLALPETEEAGQQIGKQGGGCIGCLSTQNCHITYETLKARGVEFIGTPQDESWGTGVMFKDLYGNIFYLSEPKK